MAVNLCAALKKTVSRAAHKVLLACFLQSCSTRRWISCTAQNIARMLYRKVNSRVTCKFGLSHSTKIEEHMCVFAHECQPRRELYHTFFIQHDFNSWKSKFMLLCCSYEVYLATTIMRVEEENLMTYSLIS